MTRRPLYVVVLSFDRPHYLHQALASLAMQVQKDDQVVLFQDGAWSPSRKEWKARQSSINLCVRIFAAYFPNSSVFVSSQNLGICGNYRRAEEFVFESLQAERGFFLEDDIVLGKGYLDIIDRMLCFAEADERIGYVAAYGDLWATIESQRASAGTFIPMHENWGAAMTRRSWLRQKKVREQYWELIKDVDYADRDHVAIFDLYERLGYRGLNISSQDGSRWIACAESDMVRLSTSTCHARYIGAAGLHFNQTLYDKYKFSQSLIYEEDIELRAPSSGRIEAILTQAKVELQTNYCHSYVHRFEDENVKRIEDIIEVTVNI